jgi:hypothetical protein
MRLKDKINKRKNLYLILVAIGFAPLIVLAFVEKYLQPMIFKPILYCAIALFCVGNILLYVGIRCPKCNSIIGYTVVFSAGEADQCPRCRVMWNEDIPEL